MEFTTSKKKLLQLLSDGRWHSGRDLADTLRISRSAVWKQVQSLCRLGLEIGAVPGKGYRLPRPLELLDKNRIEAGLAACTRGLLHRLELHDEIPSTNDHLVAGIPGSTASGTVCLAERQTAGKGRMGREWISPLGRNIYLSVLWRFTGGPAVLTGLSVATGVAVKRALVDAGITETALKWPNDIVWQRRKVGGILVEVSGENCGPCAAVVGLGLNMYMPTQVGEAITQAWADIEQMGIPETPSRNRLVALILNELLPLLANYERTGLEPYLSEWTKWDCLSGEKVTLFSGLSAIRGTVRGITNDGMLLIENEADGVKPYASGEVTFHREIN